MTANDRVGSAPIVQYPDHDVIRTRQQLDSHPDDHYLRRSYIVQSITRIEHEVRVLRRLTLELAADEHWPGGKRQAVRACLDEGTVMFLRDEVPKLQDNGEMRRRPLRESYDRMLLFTLKVAACCAGREVPAHGDLQGWDAFKRTSLRLRNDVVHGRADDTISDALLADFEFGLSAADALIQDVRKSLLALLGLPEPSARRDS